MTEAPPGSVRLPDRTLDVARAVGDRQQHSRSAGASRGLRRAPALQPVVIQFGRFGDMVMLIPVLQLLHRRFGRPCLVLAAGPWNAPLYLNHPDIARVWCFSRYLSMALGFTWWRAITALRGSAPGPVYVCERQPRQAQRIRRLLAFSRIDPGRCLYITDERSIEGEHWVDRLLHFAQRTPPAVEAADYPVPADWPAEAPRIAVTDAERAELRVWLEARGWAGRRLILVQPGNFRSMSRGRGRGRGGGAALPGDDKAWPLEHWVALLRKMHASFPGALIMLCGAPQEGAMLEEIRRATALAQVVAAELPMRRLLALCELAHSMISVDTGPAHAAAALGLPLIVLFGAQPQSLWLPRGACGSPVIGIGGPPRSLRVDEIPVDEVFNEWQSLPPPAEAASRCTPN